MKKLTEDIEKNLEDKDNMIKAQQDSLIELSKKINTLQTENETLKKQLEDLAKEVNWGLTKDLETLGDEDAEIICKKQIDNLKTISNERNLTLEETRKLETFVKVLTQIRLKGNDNTEELKKTSDVQLLKLVQDENVES